MHYTKSTCFVIHNYNTDPTFFTQFDSNYVIYDVSDNIESAAFIKEKYKDAIFTKNSGHNLTSYFDFLSSDYSRQYEFIALLKGNMIGRHIDEDAFIKKISKQCYTHLYSNRNYVCKVGTAFQVWDGAHVEYNDSWYVNSNKCTYFLSFNSCLEFVFKDPIKPRYVLFSPGGCYLLNKHNFQSYPPAFWRNLKYLVSYDFFPGEAYFIERMLPLIFLRTYEINDWMADEDKFHLMLESVRLKRNLTKQNRNLIERIKSKLRYLID